MIENLIVFLRSSLFIVAASSKLSFFAMNQLREDLWSVDVPDPSTIDDYIAEKLDKCEDGDIVVGNYGIQLLKRDLEKLQGLNWLTDPIISFYLFMIEERSETSSRYPSVYAFNTYFFTDLEEHDQSNQIESSFSSVTFSDLFAKQIILIPVYKPDHWTLIVLNLEESSINFYDSSRLYDGHTEMALILRFMKIVHLKQRKVEMSQRFLIQTAIEPFPRQENNSDCGVFICQYSEHISRNATMQFTQEDMQWYRRTMIYEILVGKLFVRDHATRSGYEAMSPFLVKRESDRLLPSPSFSSLPSIILDTMSRLELNTAGPLTWFIKLNQVG